MTDLTPLLTDDELMALYKDAHETAWDDADPSLVPKAVACRALYNAGRAAGAIPERSKSIGDAAARDTLAEMWRRWCAGEDADDIFASSKIQDVLADGVQSGGGVDV